MSSVDTKGNAIVVRALHAHTHEGTAYAASQFNAALAAGASLLIQLQIPTEKTVHLKEPTLYTTGSTAKFEMRYEPTVTDGTTEITPVKRRPSSPFDSGITLFSDPSAISVGTLLEEFSIGSGGASSGGGDAKGEDEWLLEGGSAGVDVTLVLTNNDASAKILSLRITWYE